MNKDLTFCYLIQEDLQFSLEWVINGRMEGSTNQDFFFEPKRSLNTRISMKFHKLPLCKGKAGPYSKPG